MLADGKTIKKQLEVDFVLNKAIGGCREVHEGDENIRKGDRRDK